MPNWSRATQPDYVSRYDDDYDDSFDGSEVELEPSRRQNRRPDGSSREHVAHRAGRSGAASASSAAPQPFRPNGHRLRENDQFGAGIFE